MTMTLLRQLRDFHRTAKEAVALAESLQWRMNCASHECLELIHDYDDFAERLISSLGFDQDSDQMIIVQAEARRLRQRRIELELDYASNDTFAQKRQRTRSFVAVFATLLLVGLAALATTYTAGYVHGENAAMEKLESRVGEWNLATCAPAALTSDEDVASPTRSGTTESEAAR